MKFFIFIALCLSVSLIDARRVRSQHKNHNKYLLRNKEQTNGFYQFLLGFLMQISGDAKFIDECSQSVPKWESVGIEEEKSGSMEIDLKHQKEIYTAALKLVRNSVIMICHFKEEIVKYLSKQLKRYIRLFIQGESRKLRFEWNVTNLIKGVDKGIKKTAKLVQDGTSKAKNEEIGGVKWVGKKLGEIETFIKKELREWFKQVYDIIDGMKKRLIDFLHKHRFLKKLRHFAKCFVKKEEVKKIKLMHNTLDEFISLKAKTSNGWVRLVVNLICHHQILRIAIKHLENALKEKQKPLKFKLFGKFTAGLLKALSSHNKKKAEFSILKLLK